MTIYSNYLKQVCIDITHKLGLNNYNQHVAAVFNDNNSHEITGWAILDANNNVLERYDDIKELYDAHANNH